MSATAEYYVWPSSPHKALVRQACQDLPTDQYQALSQFLGKFIGYHVPDGPPLYVICHVDDLVHYSESDFLEDYFDTSLSCLICVDFIDPMMYYISICFNWSRGSQVKLCVYLSHPLYCLTKKR